MFHPIDHKGRGAFDPIGGKVGLVMRKHRLGGGFILQTSIHRGIIHPSAAANLFQIFRHDFGIVAACPFLLRVKQNVSRQATA